MSGIIQCFLNVDMRNGHDGLTKLSKENGVITQKIEPGNFVVFVNSRRDKLKLFAANQVIAYLRMPAGRKIEMRVIKELPRVFNGKKIDYDQALSLALDKALREKQSALTVI